MSPTRIFLTSGILSRACTRGFWSLFFLRLVTEVQLEPFQLVLLGTVMELSILLFEIPTGIVADLYSRKWSVAISFVIVGAAYALSANADVYWLLVLSQIMVGFGSTFVTGAETAWITDELGSAEEAEPLILRRAGYQLWSAVAGIIVFAGLAALTSLSLTLSVIGVIYAAWGFVLIAVMPENNFVRSVGEGWRGFLRMLQGGWSQSYQVRPLRILVIAVFIGGLAKEAIDRLDVQRLVDVGLPDDIDEVLVIGALVAANSLIGAGMLAVAKRRARGSSVVPAMSILLVGVAVGILLLAHMQVLALAGLGLILQGGFFLTTIPLVTTWANTFASSENRATVHSFVGQAEAFGEILGGIALGALAQFTTVPTAMTVSAGLFLLAAGIASTARYHWAGA